MFLRKLLFLSLLILIVNTSLIVTQAFAIDDPLHFKKSKDSFEKKFFDVFKILHKNHKEFKNSHDRFIDEVMNK